MTECEKQNYFERTNWIFWFRDTTRFVETIGTHFRSRTWTKQQSCFWNVSISLDGQIIFFEISEWIQNSDQNLLFLVNVGLWELTISYEFGDQTLLTKAKSMKRIFNSWSQLWWSWSDRDHILVWVARIRTEDTETKIRAYLRCNLMTLLISNPSPGPEVWKAIWPTRHETLWRSKLLCDDKSFGHEENSFV